MNNTFLPPKKIVLEIKENVLFFNFKNEKKKLSQICTHFQIEGVESQN